MSGIERETAVILALAQSTQDLTARELASWAAVHHAITFDVQSCPTKTSAGLTQCQIIFKN